MMTIKEMINSRGYSIAELSKLTNISRQTIYNILKGKNTTTKILFSVVKTLGYTLDDLK